MLNSYAAFQILSWTYEPTTIHGLKSNQKQWRWHFQKSPELVLALEAANCSWNLWEDSDGPDDFASKILSTHPLLCGWFGVDTSPKVGFARCVATYLFDVRRYAWLVQVEEKQHQGLLALGSWKISWSYESLLRYCHHSYGHSKANCDAWCKFFLLRESKIDVDLRYSLTWSCPISESLLTCVPWKALEASSKMWRLLPKAKSFLCRFCLARMKGWWCEFHAKACGILQHWLWFTMLVFWWWKLSTFICILECLSQLPGQRPKSMGTELSCLMLLKKWRHSLKVERDMFMEGDFFEFSFF